MHGGVVAARASWTTESWTVRSRTTPGSTATRHRHEAGKSGAGGNVVGVMFVSDLRHFLELPDEVPGPARRMAQHLANIVRAATTSGTGVKWVTAISCNRRPRNRSCTGTIAVVLRDIPSVIEWVCTSCRDDGVISGWEQSPFDLRHTDPNPTADSPMRVTVPVDVIVTLRTLALLDAATERLVFAATINDAGEAVLVGSQDDLDELADHVAAEANHTDNRRHQKRLDAAFDLLRDHLATSTS